MSDTEIKTKFQELADSFDTHPGSSRGRVSEGQDGSLVVEYTGTRDSIVDAFKLIEKAFKLIEKLEVGGLIEGKRAPRTDMDTAMDELGPDNPFKIGDNVTVSVNNAGNFQLSFTSSKPVGDVVLGLKAGIESAQADASRRVSESKDWAERVRRDDELNKAEPVFSPKEDVRVVSEYLTARVEEAFPGSNPRVTYKARGVMGKPEFDVRLDHKPGESLAAFNDFHHGLGKVFDGVTAVHPHMGGSNTDSEIGFSVEGNPARLIGDIKRNDPDKLPQTEIKK